jgi:hypothetical protein
MLFGVGTEQAVLLLMQAPYKGGFTFFVIFNSLMEWLFLPALLFFNWRIQARRKPLITGTLLYYAARTWTYIYFVPAIFKLMHLPAGDPLSPDLVNDIMQ